MHVGGGVGGRGRVGGGLRRGVGGDGAGDSPNAAGGARWGVGGSPVRLEHYLLNDKWIVSELSYNSP